MAPNDLRASPPSLFKVRPTDQAKAITL